MKRREAMKRVAAIMGASLSVSTLAVFQQSCQTGPDPEPGVFSEQDSETLNIVGGIIIPETDTPGAAAVNTGAFAVMMLEDCYSQDDRMQVTDFLSLISEDFNGKNSEDQVQKIIDIDGIVYGDGSEEEKGKYEGYKIIKELTLFGYFTSEPGMTKALNHVAIPGRYEGCIDLKPGQKAWA